MSVTRVTPWRKCRRDVIDAQSALGVRGMSIGRTVESPIDDRERNRYSDRSMRSAQFDEFMTPRSANARCASGTNGRALAHAGENRRGRLWGPERLAVESWCSRL